MTDTVQGSPKGTFHARGAAAKERGHLPVPNASEKIKEEEEAKKEHKKFLETMRGGENLYRPSTNF